MDNDLASGYRGDYQPRDYYHNKVIRMMAERKKKIAWERALRRTEVLALQQEQLAKKQNRKFKGITTTPSFTELLAMYK